MSEDIFEFWSKVKPDENIHPADLDILGKSSRIKHSFELECLPTSYFGALRTARVVLLYLSPGFNKKDKKQARTSEGQKLYAKYRSGYGLLPKEDEHEAWWKWWTQRVKCFAEDSKHENWHEHFRDKIAFLNICGYHSREFHDHHALAALPSCRKALDWAQHTLFPQAVRGEKIVICMRSAKYWGLKEQLKPYGKSLFVPNVIRNGHMRKLDLRDEIIKRVKLMLYK